MNIFQGGMKQTPSWIMNSKSGANRKNKTPINQLFFFQVALTDRRRPPVTRDPEKPVCLLESA